MSRFWAGFGVASLLWGASVAYLLLGAGLGPPADPSTIPALGVAPAAIPSEEPLANDPPRRSRRSSSTQRSRVDETPRGIATSGDDLGEDAMRTIDVGASGGEQQLSPAQIEVGVDSGMARIRRCLVLAAGDEPVTGRLTFAMRVAPSGEVRAVQLTGPAVATTGEAGDCLRAAARSIRFAPFDGPEMVLRYPLELS